MQVLDSITDAKLVSLLKSGGIGIVPTDTVYGVVCQAANPISVARLYAVKHREHKPGTIIAARLQQLIDLGLRGRYLKAVENFWPNPLSVVVPCGEELAYIHQGKQSLAVRIPANDELRELLAQTGPLLTSSANLTDQPTATTIDEAKQYFGDTVDFYVDGGKIVDHEPSTVIRVVDDAIEVLRKGALGIDENGRIAK